MEDGQVPNTESELDVADNEKNTIESLPDWAQTIIKGLRTESAKHRTENKKLKDEAEGRRLAELSEIDREKAENQKLIDRVSAMETKVKLTKIHSKAIQKHFHNPELVAKLIDLDSVDIDNDDSLSAALDTLITENPFLIKSDTKPVVPHTKPSTPEGKNNFANLTKADLFSGKVDIQSIPTDIYLKIMNGK